MKEHFTGFAKLDLLKLGDTLYPHMRECQYIQIALEDLQQSLDELYNLFEVNGASGVDAETAVGPHASPPALDKCQKRLGDHLWSMSENYYWLSSASQTFSLNDINESMYLMHRLIMDIESLLWSI